MVWNKKNGENYMSLDGGSNCKYVWIKFSTFHGIDDWISLLEIAVPWKPAKVEKDSWIWIPWLRNRPRLRVFK